MRHVVLAALSAIPSIGCLATSLSVAEAGPRARVLARDVPFVVTLVSPTRGQHTSPDLSDPGLNNVITVRFASIPLSRDVVDEGNGVNGLSRKCVFRDQAFAPVAASAYLRRNVLTLDPFTAPHPVMAQGTYTLEFAPSIRSLQGRRLNEGRGAFTTRFTVGRSRLPVVLLGVSPHDGETDVGLRRSVVATFDRPMDALSAAASVRLEDRSTDPPTPVYSLVTVDRHGYDVVVVPGSPGLPPGADLAIVISGRGTATTGPLLKTADGVEFKRDWGPRWWALPAEPTLFHSDLGTYDDVTGEFTVRFRTRDPARASSR